MLHSLAWNHALVDGNKRLAWTAMLTFYRMNGVHLSVVDDEAFDLVLRVAEGHEDDVGKLADRLRRAR